jgi:hypothetical protein
MAVEPTRLLIEVFKMIGATKFGGAAMGPTPTPVAPMVSTVNERP